jgi:hypothetical protein
LEPPFRYDITEKLKLGVNTVNIAVTNLWPNRLIGDAAFPENKRVTKTNYNHTSLTHRSYPPACLVL